MTRVDVHFDFVSPYAYLGLALLPELAAEHGVEWEPRPVVYAALLDATGLVGPVESDLKRRYTLADIRRAAELAGLPLVGPPAHPFRSLEALRLVLVAEDLSTRRRLAVRLATAAWAEGRDLTDLRVLADEADRCGLDGQVAIGHLGEPAIKRSLREQTEAALGRGVFGVPTFVWKGELFWGHDRLGHLVARIEGRIADPRDGLEGLVERPRGAVRKGRTRGPAG